MYKQTLIAESGSTKTDWVLVDGDTKKYYSTIGLNPYILGSEEVFIELNTHEFFKNLKTAELEVFFYGSGCSSDKRKGIILAGLKKLFSTATIEIFHDIDAAVNATCDNKAGIVGILGTGSNCVYFDGSSIQYGHPSPGYLLGDEGGGTHLGKSLLRDILYKVPPSAIIDAFYKTYQYSPEELIDKVYSANKPNAYIASFVKFLGEHANHNYTEELVHKCFNKFVKFHIVQFPEASDAPVHFVGSVAFYFESILKEVLDDWKIEKGTVLKSPLDGLIAFHSPS